MSSILVYLQGSSDYTNLGQASAFAGLNDALGKENSDLTLIAPKNDLLSKEKIPDVYRWNAKLTEALLLNHVAMNTVEFPSGGVDLKMLSEEELLFTNTEVTTGKENIAIALRENKQDEYLIYDAEGVLIPQSQIDTPALKMNLFDGAAVRLGTFFEGYAKGDFYDALKELNNDGSNNLFSEKLGYTVFLPEAKAWASLTKEVENKPGTKEYLEDGGLETTLKAHAVAGAAAVTSQTFNSLGNTDVVVNIPAVTIANESSTILNTKPVNFKNGQVHEINSVLEFPRKTTVEIAAATADTKTLVDLVTKYELVESLNGLNRSTIFAPTNKALNPLVTYATWNTIEITADVITKILLHHVIDKRLYKSDLPANGEVTDGLDGEAILLSELDVATFDVKGTNGNIHIINKPLVPPTFVSAIPAFETVVDIAKDTTITSSLYAYLSLLEDIVEVLQKIEPNTSFTVFAPNNQAFEALSTADLEYLTDNENEKLREVLTYHVVPSAALAASLEPTNEFPTVLGSTLKVTVDGEMVKVGSGAAQVVGADVKAINGVVHVIDQILVPESVVLPSSEMFSSASSITVSVVMMAIASVCIAAF